MFGFGPNSVLIDVTAPLVTGMAVWPGDAAFELTPTSRMTDGSPCNVSKLSCSTHAGTHVDAPWHFVENGDQLDDIAVERWCGPCHVVDIDVDRTRITAEDLNDANVPAETERLILRTTTTAHEATRSFNSAYAALSPGAATWLLERRIGLVGIDTPSVEPVDDENHEVHQALLGAGMLIVEGLVLSEVEPGPYWLICLPLRLMNADGAPARAMLIKDQN